MIAVFDYEFRYMQEESMSPKVWWRTISTGMAVGLLMVALSFTAAAQTFRGSILGTVVDPNGAAVPEVTVTVRNVDTGLERSTVTDGAGNFLIPELPIGNYELTARRSGFQTASVTGLRVEVAGERRVDVTLSPGRVEETVVTSVSRYVESQYQYYQSLYRQQRNLVLVQLASPAGAYYFLTTSLCGTGGSSYFHFLTSGFRYRSELLGYFRSHNLFASPTLFTAQPALDLSGLPPFAEQDWRKDDLWQIALGFASLMLLMVTILITTSVLFLRFDVR